MKRIQDLEKANDRQAEELRNKDKTINKLQKQKLKLLRVNLRLLVKPAIDNNPNINNSNYLNVDNPNVDNPNVNNPNIDNPNIDNLNVDNPNVDNPNVDNPNVDNPVVQVNSNDNNPNNPDDNNDVKVIEEAVEVQVPKPNIYQFTKLSDIICQVSLRDRAEQFLELKDDLSSLGEELGKGAYGNVYKATYQGREVAVKTMTGKFKNLCVEVELNLVLSHKNILSAHFYFFSLDQKINIVMPLMDTDLRKEAERRKPQPYFSHAQANRICFEISKGLEYLHSVNIVHRDLKPENVMLSSTNEVKIADFGNCGDFSRKLRNVKEFGTYPYIAPENILESKGDSQTCHSSPADIWPLGVIFCELLSPVLNAPFVFADTLPEKDQIPIIKTFAFPEIGTLSFQFEKIHYQLTQDQNNIARQCLKQNPLERSKAFEVKKLFEALPHATLF